MPRKNIFKAEKLTLDYDGQSFVLRRNGNPSGSRYKDVRSASNLKRNIYIETEKSEHEMEFRTKEFNITLKAQVLLDEYEKKIRQPSPDSKSKLETLAKD